MEDPRHGEDAAVDGPGLVYALRFYLVSVLLSYVHAALFILTDIYFQITSKCNNVRLVLSNTGSGLFCRIGTVLPLFFLYSDINVAQAPITPF